MNWHSLYIIIRNREFVGATQMYQAVIPIIPKVVLIVKILIFND